jgi:hypothetical protein
LFPKSFVFFKTAPYFPGKWAQSWWHRLDIPALRKLKHKHFKFKVEASLDYLARPCFLKQNKKQSESRAKVLH